MSERSISWRHEHDDDSNDNEFLITRRDEDNEDEDEDEAPAVVAPRVAPRVTTATTAPTSASYWSENAWGMRLSCPITHQLFTDPVMASDGFLYERGPIERWFQTRGTSPLTRARIDGVFHAVPSVRNEVAAFLASMEIGAARRWRRWARTAEFQATIDALERDLAPKMTAVPIEWRRLMHESPTDWDCWMDAARLCAPVTVDAQRRDQETPEGTAAAKLGRRYGWTEEAMANVWHQLPALAAGVDEPSQEDHDDHEDRNDTCSLVYRAVTRLLAYTEVTCAGYIMAGPTVARCAETEAWAAATAVVRCAPELDTNILVRTLAASFADTTPGWRLIAEVCRRELGAAAPVEPSRRSSVPSSSPSSSLSVKRKRREEDDMEEEEDESGGGSNDDVDDAMSDGEDASELEEMEGELLDTGDGFLIEVTRRDSESGDENDEADESDEREDDSTDDQEDDRYAVGTPAGTATAALPATFGQVARRSRAEELAFEAAMATVDSRADGLFSYDDHDDRRRGQQYQRRR